MLWRSSGRHRNRLGSFLVPRPILVATSGDTTSGGCVVETDDGDNVQCPVCGSRDIQEFRMGVNRYRVTRSGTKFEQVIDGSEDVIFRRCTDCQHGSDTDQWSGSAEEALQAELHRQG